MRLLYATFVSHRVRYRISLRGEIDSGEYSEVLIPFEYYLKGAADSTGGADSFTLGTPATLRCFNICYNILY